MSYFDDNEDRIIYGKRPAGAAPDVTCKRCGKDGLRWQDEDGEWVLMEGRHKVHHCDPKDVRATSLDGFHAL
ncbi:hypothetical protein ABS755_07190 [Castellaniella sp. FW104-16D08]|uniref:hypothetical protein n=1 Tax=unclassified Castellaniella TaxID=2617606 RepID=UPI00331594D2